MFTLEAPKSYNIRSQLLHKYQEQQSDLDVVFKCSNGKEQRCSRLVLNLVSQFYTEQLEGRDRLDNGAEFNYDFSIECVKTFLDYMHGISTEELSLVTLMEMVKFIKFEGKDKSDFENGLLGNLCDKLKHAKLSVDAKLMVCVVCNSFDDFQSNFEKTFFGNCSKNELRIQSYDVDVTTNDNQKLRKLMGHNVTDKDIEYAIFQLVKQLQNIKLTPTSCAWDTLEVTIEDSDMTKAMEEHAIYCARQAHVREDKNKSLTAFIVDEFRGNYGGNWNCIQNPESFRVTPTSDKYIYFKMDNVGFIILFTSHSLTHDSESDFDLYSE